MAKSPACHRRARATRQKLRRRAKKRCQTRQLPLFKDLIRLTAHHSKPAHRELLDLPADSNLHMGKQSNRCKQGWQQDSSSSNYWGSSWYRGGQQQQQAATPAAATIIPYDQAQLDDGKNNKDQDGSTGLAPGQTNVGSVQRALNQARKVKAKGKRVAQELSVAHHFEAISAGAASQVSTRCFSSQRRSSSYGTSHPRCSAESSISSDAGSCRSCRNLCSEGGIHGRWEMGWAHQRFGRRRSWRLHGFRCLGILAKECHAVADLEKCQCSGRNCWREFLRSQVRGLQNHIAVMKEQMLVGGQPTTPRSATTSGMPHTSISRTCTWKRRFSCAAVLQWTQCGIHGPLPGDALQCQHWAAGFASRRRWRRTWTDADAWKEISQEKWHWAQGTSTDQGGSSQPMRQGCHTSCQQGVFGRQGAGKEGHPHRSCLKHRWELRSTSLSTTTTTTWRKQMARQRTGARSWERWSDCCLPFTLWDGQVLLWEACASGFSVAWSAYFCCRRSFDGGEMRSSLLGLSWTLCSELRVFLLAV